MQEIEMNVRQLLIDSGINAPAADLLGESFLRSPMAKIMLDKGEPLKFFLPIQRGDCPGWVGVDITISAVDKLDK
jgi:hypothetical protein